MKRTGKLITLVLVVAMALSLMSVAALADSSSYDDVVAGKWYVKYVDWAVNEGLMDGVSDTEWAPNTATTRGMVITTLYAMAGKPEVEGDSPFADVAEGKYYTDAVKWAVEAGVASGKSSDAFKPEDELTRQEAATFFCAFAKNVWKLDVSEVSGMNKYPDKDDVANYAKDAMGWAVKAEVISGSKEDGVVKLMPKRNITRAELATMLKALKELEPIIPPTPPVTYETADVVINLTSEDPKDNTSEVLFFLVGTDKNGNPVSTQGKTNKEGKLVFKNVVVSGEDPYQLIEQNFDGSPNGKYFVEGYEDNVLDVDVVGPTTEINIKHEFKQEKLNVFVKSEDVDSTLEGIKVQVTGKSAAGSDVEKWTTTNRNGLAKFNLPVGNYKVEVVELADYYVAPAAKSVKVTNTHTAATPADKVGVPFETTLKIALKTGSFKVQFVDEKGKALDLRNVKVTLSGEYASGTEAPKMSEVSVKGGTAVFRNVPYSSAEGYVLTPVASAEIKDYEYDAQTVVVDKADLGVINIVMKKITKGVLEITKVNEKGQPVEGAVFELTDPKGKVVGTKTTDENGIAAFKDLEAAKKEKYSLVEVSAPAGYEVATGLKVPAIADKTTATIKVVDKYQLAQVKLNVVVLDPYTGAEKPVQGVQVIMGGAPITGWPENGEKEVSYRSSLSDEDGNIWFDEDGIRLSNTLKGYAINVKEDTIPSGMKLLSDDNRLFVTADGPNAKTIYLVSDKVTINVTVESADTGLGLPEVAVKFAGKELVSGQAVDETASTDKDGKVSKTFYAPNSKGYTITISDEDYVAEKVVVKEQSGKVDVVIKATLKSTKTDETDTQKAPDAK